MKPPLKSRQRDYGHPSENLGKTAKLFTACFSGKVEWNAEDVALAMILLKVARESHRHKEDNLIDIIGYCHCIKSIKENHESVS